MFTRGFQGGTLVRGRVVSRFYQLYRPNTLLCGRFRLVISTPRNGKYVVARAFSVVGGFLASVYLGLQYRFVSETYGRGILPCRRPRFVARVGRPILEVVTTTPSACYVGIHSLTLGGWFSNAFSKYSLRGVILESVIDTRNGSLVAICFVDGILTPLIFLSVRNRHARASFSTPNICGLVSNFRICLRLVWQLFSRSV